MYHFAWATKLHEIGLTISHGGYHKHSAYILENADMPGFSRMDQGRLSNIVLGHRGKLERVQAVTNEPRDWLLIFCLRLAALLHRARDDAAMPSLGVAAVERGFHLLVDGDWLTASPLTAATLDEEVRQWKALGMELRIRREHRSSRQMNQDAGKSPANDQSA